MHVCMLSHFSRVRLFATPWTVAWQAPLSMGFSRQEYWSGLPCPSGDLPDPGIEPVSFRSPALAGRFFTTSATAVPVFNPSTASFVNKALRNTVMVILYTLPKTSLVLLTAELSSFDKDYMAHKTRNIFYLSLCQKTLLTLLPEYEIVFLWQVFFLFLQSASKKVSF